MRAFSWSQGQEQLIRNVIIQIACIFGLQPIQNTHFFHQADVECSQLWLHIGNT